MSTTSGDAWGRIWEERGRDYPDDDPALIAGYDQPFSRLDSAAADALASLVAERLELGPSDLLLDVGCGAGMLLSRLAPRVALACGTDRAQSLVERTRRLFPRLDVRQADASALPFADASFTRVLLHGVVQYFPDESAVTAALDEAFRVCRPEARVLLGDVMNAETREAYLERRSALGGGAAPRWKSSVTDPAPHLYLTRAFFERHAAERALQVSVLERPVPGYENARFRFDVLLRRDA